MYIQEHTTSFDRCLCVLVQVPLEETTKSSMLIELQETVFRQEAEIRSLRSALGADAKFSTLGLGKGVLASVLCAFSSSLECGEKLCRFSPAK